MGVHSVERSQRYHVEDAAGGNASRCAWSRQASRSVRISSSIAFRVREPLLGQDCACVGFREPSRIIRCCISLCLPADETGQEQ